MTSDLHEQLNRVGAQWAKRQGFPIVATNVWAAGSRERVDVVAFRQGATMLIESKVSRSDYHADKKKPERTVGGIGLYRFYITTVALIEATELPPGWGLLYAKGTKVIEVRRPLGNLWPSLGTSNTDWIQYQHQSDAEAERAVLFSIARRATQGKILYL